jgi:DNA-binding CsgD family transcriptional regulator
VARLAGRRVAQAGVRAGARGGVVLPLRGGHVAAWVSVGRPTGRRFTPRQHALLEALHARCADLYAADLRLVAPDVLALSGQQRQCLQYLLAGETERGVARRLRLSQNTVHHHIKGIYRSLGVSTRGGLLAKWVGQADGNGAAHDAAAGAGIASS